MPDLRPIPAAYLQPIDDGGRVIRVDYTTSAHDGRTLQKFCYVYLPHGHDREKQYNVLYCLHGVGGDLEAYFHDGAEPTPLKLALDHMIANGDIDPIIAVSPSYYAQDPALPPTGSAAEVRRFQQELIHDLIPAVEGQFGSYAETLDPAGIAASREHRAYAGFSLGSLSTWFTFIDCVDYFRGFIPMSGDCWPKGVDSPNLRQDPEVARAAAEWLEEVAAATERDFFIYAVTGSADVAGDAMAVQMEAMRKYAPSFRFVDEDGQPGNICFRVEPDATHDYIYVPLYFYNALPTLWGGADR